jgi:predicted amino acid racemase
VSRVTIDLHALEHNLSVVKSWMDHHTASWTVVTKVLCGHADTLRALQLLGVRSMGDSRLDNLRAIEKIVPDFEAWYLRVADLSSVEQVAKHADVSLNSEVEVIELLNEESSRLDKIHRVIIMIELGDLREGILPGTLIRFYEHVFKLPNIEVLGIGANLGCLAGAVPSIDQFMQLVLYRELLELKFKRKLAMISAGSSVTLPLLLDGGIPRAINHFRIGEAIFLGTDLVNGGTLAGLRDDVVLLEAEIAEIKEKTLLPTSEVGTLTPFESEQSDESISPGQRGYRALVSIGQLDTDIAGLTPVNPDYRVAGASSDITVVNVGDNPKSLEVGGTISFRVNYAAMLRLMSSKYVDKEVTPPLSEFKKTPESAELTVEPTLKSVDEQSQ